MRFLNIKGIPDNDRGPCVPAALSAILGVSFDQINQWLVYKGCRRRRTKGSGSLAVGGTFTDRINMSEIGLISYISVSEPMRGLSVNQFCKKYDRGSYLIQASNHCLAVVEGIAYDCAGDPSKKRVQGVWKKIENKLPWDWSRAQGFFVNEEIRKSAIIKKQQTLEKRKQYYKRYRERVKEQNKTVDHKVAALLKRKKAWETKLKRAKTTLSGIERKIKYYQRKNTQNYE